MGNSSTTTRDEFVMIILWVSITLYTLCKYHHILASLSSKNFALPAVRASGQDSKRSYLCWKTRVANITSHHDGKKYLYRFFWPNQQKCDIRIFSWTNPVWNQWGSMWLAHLGGQRPRRIISGGVALEVNLRNNVQKGSTQARYPLCLWNPGQTSKTEVSVAPEKKDYCPPKFIHPDRRVGDDFILKIYFMKNKRNKI